MYNRFIGETGVITEISASREYPYTLKADDGAEIYLWQDEELQKVGKNAKTMKEKPTKFILIYEIDEDPVEYFLTLIAMEKRIKELDEQGGHSFRAFPVGKELVVDITKQVTIK